ncbi:MAG TPA: ParA family protein [Spirochaetota bacterium]|nr:ParA family protein [Spirochaetota bacterium]HOJ27784.1 ParA family protein [Spirochaetota bacterium]HOM08897.1 ParA family protein [Spirochaetota bacterium]HPP48693.1 ParA family protein [Spirochaetota bacterium]
MRIIAISNNKGGVGKTTSTVNIAAALQILGKKVLVIDIDHQAQSTYHFGYNPNNLTYSVYNVLKGEIAYKDVIIDRDGLHILPSKNELKDIEFIPLPAKEFLLKEALEGISGYDFILIDCPPSLGILTLNALTFAHEILVPLQVQFLPFHGMYNLFEAVQMVKRRLNKEVEITGIIGTMFNPKKQINVEVIEETKKRLPGKLFETLIRENVLLQEAPSWGKTIFEYKPNSNGAVDYMNLTKEILEKDVN